MTWRVELSGLAQKHLEQLDPQQARRILGFLYERVSKLDHPRGIGEAVKGSKIWRFLEVSRGRLSDYCQH